MTSGWTPRAIGLPHYCLNVYVLYDTRGTTEVELLELICIIVGPTG
jgi:hypothetical protein